ncbi:MAG: triose-phosphate isomerase [archaeon]|nr:MAG: triose-phosphate isomerase [archaeon]
MRRTLILNFKNYAEIQGEGSVRLAAAALRVARKVEVEVIVAPPIPLLGLVVGRVRGATVYSQSADGISGDKTTGSILPESIRAAGAKGAILNHSESRMSYRALQGLVPRMKASGIGSCVCSKTPAEAQRVSYLGPKFVAVEPPELIGTGVSVSRARPGLIKETVERLRSSGYRGRILCGAGIVSGEDVARAVNLGTDGILVASSVVKAKDWASKLEELSEPLSR